jgi:exopolysaccharide biosynthesis predicted pyruvyltransferase EpsI
MIIAQEYLDRYRKEAKLVITSRLHCALPCIAMGIPVIVMGDHRDKRLQLVEEFTKIHPYFAINMRGAYKNIDSTPKLIKVFIKEVFQFIYYRVMG